MKLLIADDDLTFRTLLAELGRQWGFTPVVVEDGEAAWQALQENDAPHLLLLDWEMPKLNGLDLCRRIRQRETADPAHIILLTARSKSDDIVEGLEAGANDYVAKPFVFAELQARLQTGKRSLDLQNQLIKAKNAFAEERAIIEKTLLALQASKRFDPENLRWLELPVERTSGDILMSAFCPNGAQHVLLGDFTGHGLTAAIGGPIIADAFYSMTAKGLPLKLVADEINHRLCEKLPIGLFLAVALIELDPERRQLLVWNCGMENVLIFRGHSLFKTIPSDGLALGIMDRPLDPATAIEVEAGDCIYTFSDGITEAANQEGVAFGENSLVSTIADTLDSGDEIGAITNTVQAFQAGCEQLDDITLVELRC